MPASTVKLLLLVPLASGSSDGPLCNFLPSPALGVSTSPRFTWAVPPCAGLADLAQTSYRVVVRAAPGGAVAWDSGVVPSNATRSVRYGGRDSRTGDNSHVVLEAPRM